MSPQVIKAVIAVALGSHAIAHVIALRWLLVQASTGSAGSRVTVSSWLIPGLNAPSAAAIASIFWALATIGFIAAALSFWGVLVPGSAWRQIAVASSIISTLGIMFFGTWPGSESLGMSIFHVGIAMTMNVAVLASLLWLHWPPQAMFGN
jgi:hypothetical protein